MLLLLAFAVGLGVRERSPAAIGLLCCPFVFALVPFASDFGTERFPDWIGNGRYFYFFTPFLALTVARLARPVVPACILAVALAATTVWGFARLYDYRESIGAGPPLEQVIEELERGGHREVFVSFWISSRLTFESEERIIAVATDLGPSYQAFEDRVRHAKRPVYVMYANDPERLADLRVRALDAGITLRETRVDGYVIVVPSGRLVAPPAIDLSRRP
ncbi:MAG: hypothetical protein WEB19_00970 [Acidimicrobiia bacterium]